MPGATAIRQADEETRARIFAFCRKHLAGLNNWDLVDTVAPKIIGEHLIAHPELRKMLHTFAGDSSLWKRRITIIATQAFIRRGDFEDTLAIAERLLHDPHDLIHKAVGWMLREVGGRDLRRLESFLERHASEMPRTCSATPSRSCLPSAAATTWRGRRQSAAFRVLLP